MTSRDERSRKARQASERSQREKWTCLHCGQDMRGPRLDNGKRRLPVVVASHYKSEATPDGSRRGGMMRTYECPHCGAPQTRVRMSKFG